MIISLISQKGGVGKSALARLLVVEVTADKIPGVDHVNDLLQTVYADLDPAGLPALQDWLTRALHNPIAFESRLIPDEQAGIAKGRGNRAVILAFDHRDDRLSVDAVHLARG